MMEQRAGWWRGVYIFQQRMKAGKSKHAVMWVRGE